MLAFLVLISSLLPTVATRMQYQGQVTPIQKVIEMLGEMAAKGKKEKNIEEVEFTKFKTWCEDTFSDKGKSIADGNAAVEQLTADIVKAESDAKVLSEEVAGHEADVAGWKKDMEEATAIREKEKADYDAAHADYSESIDAVKQAIQVLGQRSADVPQSLLQLQQSKLIPEKTKAVVASLLEAEEGTMEFAPEANAYEFQSGGVIKILEKLLHKFEDERFALEKAEMTANANYDMLMQKLTGNIAAAEGSISTKTEAKAERLGDAADAKGDLEKTSAALAEDEQILADTKAECSTNSKEFEKNQVTRAGEVEAIEKAIEILSSPAVSGNAEKHLPTLIQLKKKPSLVQLRSTTSKDAKQAKAAAFLAEKAKALNSRYLQVLSVRAAADPFAKVKKMIRDLIVKLMEEANAEADHKGFCDTELATNKQTRENLSSEIDKLQANVDEKEALSSQLTTSIKELSDAIAEIKAKQAEATSMRSDEKAKNGATVDDAKEGQIAVEKALKVLKDFYAGAAEALLQKKTVRAPYGGQQDESTGVIGFLEVILSDFARLESDTSSGEDSAQASYEKFMAESQQDAEVKQAEVDHKTLKKQQTEEALANLKKDLERTQEELQTALDYYEKLKPQCVDMGLSYEDRVAKRKEEIVSLQEALRILSGEDIA
jgi:peptidoglycan hydrolase CwlO-like protein